MTKNSLETTEKEHKALKDMYRSEGYAIMLRMLDVNIGTKFNSMMGSLNDSEVVALCNQIKGVRESKEIVFNVIKEGESKYENKTT